MGEGQVCYHEMQILLKCVKRLDSMKHGQKDYRPKTKQALQNALSRETTLLYVSSVLGKLYEYPNGVSFYEYEDIFIKDTDLDDDNVVSNVSSRCAAEGRRLFVLTSDSALYRNIESQIKKWYDQKECPEQRENLIHGISRASCMDLSAGDLYNKLVQFGYIVAGDDTEAVTFQLPDKICLNALDKVLREWEKRIAESLQDSTKSEIDYASDVDASTVENEDDAKKVPSESAKMFPLNMPPEVAHVLVHLAKIKTPALTSKDVISQIESILNNSPKYVDQHESSCFKKDNQVYIGTVATVVWKDVSEITQLALLLSFPGLCKILKKFDKQLKIIQYKRSDSSKCNKDCVTVPMHDIKETLKGFQQHILKLSRTKAERQRATIVLNDFNAEARCRERLFKYLDETNKDQTSLTETEFSKKLIECSYELSSLPCDTVMQKLVDLGYLTLSNMANQRHTLWALLKVKKPKSSLEDGTPTRNIGTTRNPMQDACL